MASNFADIYSDYQDEIKMYTEKLDVTERQFMRNLTRGMQKFQRETNYIERYATITPNVDGIFHIPDDCLMVTELRTPDDVKILPQDYMQMARNIEKAPTGFLETPFDYTLRTPLRMPDGNALSNQPNGLGTADMQMYSIWARRIYLYLDFSATSLLIRYIPDIEAFSKNSLQWNTVDSQGNPDGWFPDTRFDTMFRTTGIHPSLAPYEDAFLAYAVSRYIRGKGSSNYAVYDRDFWAEVARGKLNKPLYFTEGVTDYFMAPWS